MNSIMKQEHREVITVHDRLKPEDELKVRFTPDGDVTIRVTELEAGRFSDNPNTQSAIVFLDRPTATFLASAIESAVDDFDHEHGDPAEITDLNKIFDALNAYRSKHGDDALRAAVFDQIMNYYDEELAYDAHVTGFGGAIREEGYYE